LEAFPIDRAYDALYRPDLVAEALAGDPTGKVKEAAGKLDLAKLIDSGPAPAVVITSPAAGSRAGDEQVSVEAQVRDAGGGIGRVEWRANGITLGVDARGLERADEGTAVKKVLTLSPGKNAISVVAYNAANLIASEPATVEVTWDGVASKTPPRLHVLVIAVNDYFDSRLNLKFSVPDAEAIADGFTKTSAKLFSEIDVVKLINDQVTTAKLDQTFAELHDKVRPSDVFVLYVAGHGKTADGRYYFIPYDFRFAGDKSIIKNGIGQEAWQKWLAGIPARKSLLLYDTCESGSLTGAGLQSRGLEQVASIDRLTRAIGRTMLTASTDDAPAFEGYRGHGVFTYALLDALGAADSNGNQTIEVTELAGYVDRTVPDISFAAFKVRQIPQMNMVGSDFPIASQLAVLDQAGPAAAIPAAPTHVVVTSVDLADSANGKPIRKLKPGTQLRVIGTSADWSEVARAGRRLGFVPSASLAPIE
jgi:hypothetical protein